MATSLKMVSNALSRSAIAALPYFPDYIASDICSTSGSNASFKNKDIFSFKKVVFSEFVCGFLLNDFFLNFV